MSVDGGQPGDCHRCQSAGSVRHGRCEICEWEDAVAAAAPPLPSVPAATAPAADPATPAAARAAPPTRSDDEGTVGAHRG